MSYEKIKKPSAAYQEIAHNWAVTRLAILGKTAIDRVAMSENPYIAIPAYADRKGGALTRRIRNYWLRARYFNATGRTASTLAGFIFAKQPVLQAPDRVVSVCDYIDDVAKEAVSELLAVGKCGFLVDMPAAPAGSMSIAEAAQLLPAITLYKAEQIIFWRTDGRRLTEVRLSETYEKQSDDNIFDYETHKRIRRLFLDEGGFYKVSVYTDEDAEQHYEIKANGARLREIPFYFAGAESNRAAYDRPPLFDLASENIGHYGLCADNLENLHYHGQGMTNIFTGLDRDEVNELNPNGLDVGAGGSNILEQGDRIEILQLGASGAIGAEMKEAESRMIMAGAMVVTNTNAQTLGAKKIEFGAATSTLKNIADNTGAALEKALKACATMIGISDSEASKITYKLNDAMPSDDHSAQDMQVMLAAIQGSILPKSSFYEVARGRGLISGTDEEIQAQLDEDPIL